MNENKEQIIAKAKEILTEKGFLPDPRFIMFTRPVMFNLAKKLVDNPNEYTEVRDELWKRIGCF